MATSKLQKAQELLGQCKVSEGGCGAVKFKYDNKDHWQLSIGEFPNLHHEQCFSCKRKEADADVVQ